MLRALAACTASKITEAESAPVCWAMTGILLRSPQTCSCSTAAARKVSPAASMTFLPSDCSFLASLPMVVVLPAPLTPTTRITNGLFGVITSGASTGFNIAASSACRDLYSASASVSCLRATFWVRLWMITAVASTPTSAVSRRVSMSSSSSSSMTFLPRNRLAMPSPMLALVLLRPCLRRAKKPVLLVSTAATTGSGSITAGAATSTTAGMGGVTCSACTSSTSATGSSATGSSGHALCSGSGSGSGSGSASTTGCNTGSAIVNTTGSGVSATGSASTIGSGIGSG
ncbi:hypothetical protein [Pseudomonas sp. 22 E 5]|nr:hypothetical protein [Pseudomonas sp. 22 E 5]